MIFFCTALLRFNKIVPGRKSIDREYLVQINPQLFKLSRANTKSTNNRTATIAHYTNTTSTDKIKITNHLDYGRKSFSVGQTINNMRQCKVE